MRQQPNNTQIKTSFIHPYQSLSVLKEPTISNCCLCIKSKEICGKIQCDSNPTALTPKLSKYIYISQ